MEQVGALGSDQIATITRDNFAAVGVRTDHLCAKPGASGVAQVRVNRRSVCRQSTEITIHWRDVCRSVCRRRTEITTSSSSLVQTCSFLRMMLLHLMRPYRRAVMMECPRRRSGCRLPWTWVQQRRACTSRSSPRGHGAGSSPGLSLHLCGTRT